MRTVFFATGPVEESARHLATLPPGAAGLRVVAPESLAAELRSSSGREVLAFRPSAVLSLWSLLRRFLESPAQVICLSCGSHYRLLKLFAYTLQPQVVFARPQEEPVTLSRAAFLWLTVRRLWARGTGVLIVEAADPELMARVEQDVRERRPEAEIVRVSQLGPLEFLRLTWEWRRFRYLVIPWTSGGHNLLKLAAWFLPAGRREIYNECADCFAARDAGMLFRHIIRRMREDAEILFWKAVGACRRIQELSKILWWKTVALYRDLLALPPGVTVLGSASGYYLRDIVADVRQKHPGEPVHGVLPPRLVRPAGALFDSFTVLRPGSPRTWWKLAARAFGPRRTGWYVLAFTNEGFYGMKLAGLLLPLGRRKIYNENHDGFLLRSPRMLLAHLHWRLYHRLFYQALTERRGRSWPVHLFHLLAYPLRLLRGLGLLMAVRLRARWLKSAGSTYPPLVKIPAPANPARQEVLDAAER